MYIVSNVLDDVKYHLNIHSIDYELFDGRLLIDNRTRLYDFFTCLNYAKTNDNCVIEIDLDKVRITFSS